MNSRVRSVLRAELPFLPFDERTKNAGFPDENPAKKIGLLVCLFGVSAIRSVVVLLNKCRSVAPALARLGFPSSVFHPFGLRFFPRHFEVLPGLRCDYR